MTSLNCLPFCLLYNTGQAWFSIEAATEIALKQPLYFAVYLNRRCLSMQVGVRPHSGNLLADKENLAVIQIVSLSSTRDSAYPMEEVPRVHTHIFTCIHFKYSKHTQLK